MRPSTFLIGGVLMFMIIVTLFVFFQRPRIHERWVVYYHGNLPISDFELYKTVVLDSDSHPELPPAHSKKQVILGYLSTSEAENYRDYYDTIIGMDVLLPAEAHGLNKEVIDIRKPAWREYFVNTLVPRVLDKGFDGLILDTIDTVLYLEEEQPQKFAGMKDAAIALIKAIRTAYPQTKIMLNRGFAVLPNVAQDIDYALAESIRTQYEPTSDTAAFFSDAVYAELTATLKKAQKANPKLKIMTLDYTPMEKANVPMIRKIYSDQRRNGFIPYVTTYDLGNRHEEPQ